MKPGNTPRRPIGSTAEALFAQWVWDTLHAIYPRKSPTVLPDVKANGTTYLATLPGVGTPLYVRVCKESDGSVWYIPFIVGGNPIAAADLPANANVFDPPA